jgi:hypothetical protein
MDADRGAAADRAKKLKFYVISSSSWAARPNTSIIMRTAFADLNIIRWNRRFHQGSVRSHGKAGEKWWR